MSLRPMPEPSSERDRLLQAQQPFLEADLGRDRRVLLSAKSLEWRPGHGREPVIAELSKLESVTLSKRPVWESLYIAALACLAFVLRSPWFVHAIFGAVALLALAACVLQRRYMFQLRLKDGQRASLFLGIGRPRAPVVQRIESVWGSLAPALTSLGVRCDPATADPDAQRSSGRA